LKRLCISLALLGTLAVSSLLLAPLETLLPPELGASIPRASFIIQPLVLVLASVALGCWATPKLGLDAPIIRGMLERTAIASLIRNSLVSAIIGGMAVTGVLVAYEILTATAFSNATDPMAAKLANFQVPLATKLLYGGIGEELIARWGLMSAFALIALKLGLLRSQSLWAGNGIAALLFGLGHIPFLFMLIPSPPLWLVATVIVGNIVPGLILGWLFSRKGIEVAMIAHAFGHLFFTLLT
jgi:membrane protease YdiL (CAAX protease family)